MSNSIAQEIVDQVNHLERIKAYSYAELHMEVLVDTTFKTSDGDSEVEFNYWVTIKGPHSAMHQEKYSEFVEALEDLSSHGFFPTPEQLAGFSDWVTIAYTMGEYTRQKALVTYFYKQVR